MKSVIETGLDYSSSMFSFNIQVFFQQVDTRYVKVYQHVDPDPNSELETSTTILELLLQSRHFNKHGRLKLKCTASLHNLYWKTAEKSAEEEKPRVHFMHNDVIDSNDVRNNVDQEEREEDNYVIRGLFILEYILIHPSSSLISQIQPKYLIVSVKFTSANN